MILGYTREAGVRNLEREIGSICRKAARRKAEGNDDPLVVTRDVVAEMLGAPRFLDEEMEERTKNPGVAIGLAWTAAGGEVLFVESSRMAGTGVLTLTGSLGDVMKESARAALTWTRAHARELGIDPDFYKTAEVHLHVPSGAIPKDGPSAGVTMTTALVSELTGRPVRGDVAMTGEITLSGKVLPIGGVKEKVLAARRVGIREVILPRQNEKNVNEDLSPELRKDMTIHLVSSIDEVLKLALTDNTNVPTPARRNCRRRTETNCSAGLQACRIRPALQEELKSSDGLQIRDFSRRNHRADFVDAEGSHLDRLVLVLMRGRVGGARRPQLRRAVVRHRLRAESRGGVERGQALEAVGDEAQLLVALARGGHVAVFAHLEAAGGQLPQKTVRGVSVLPHQQHAPVVGDRQQDDRPVVAHDLEVGLAAVGKLDAVDGDVEDAAFIHQA